MTVRIRAVSLIVSFVAALLVVAAPTPEPARAAGPRVAVIVGPVGWLSDTYRSSADRVASAAAAAGASVVKAYSPNATWDNVMVAVNGADVIVYYGHGNGYPNPYTSGTEWTDRVNGWGLNRTTTNGDADSWSSTLVYCGEKALLGTLGSGDGAAQRTYCDGGPITPAPGFTMVYAQAHYAPGFGERYDPDDPLTTLAQAQQRVRNYSYPVLRLGAGAFIATAYSDADDIVRRLLTQPDATYGDIFRAGEGFSGSTLTVADHPDVAGAEYWVQRTTIGGLHFGDPDYWYAFAGNPSATPGGGMGSFVPAPFTDIGDSRFYDDIVWLAEQDITHGCGGTLFCPDRGVDRDQMASFLARALELPATSRDHFTDDEGNVHEANINRLAEAGITHGCGGTRFCPDRGVDRDQMASFLARVLDLPATSRDWYPDDDGNIHEDNINRFAEAGITHGCRDGTLFCPDGGVTREQMAAFLHRALGDD